MLKHLSDIWLVFSTEVRRVFNDKMVLLIFFIAPLLYPLIFCYMYSNENVQHLPVAVVDEARCEASHRFVYKLEATPEQIGRSTRLNSSHHQVSRMPSSA